MVSDQSSRAFKEVVIIRHPRIGEYALGFITSTVALRGAGIRGDQDLACVYVPTNNLYLGDIFLMSRADVIIPDLSVREAIGIYRRPSVLSLCLWFLDVNSSERGELHLLQRSFSQAARPCRRSSRRWRASSASATMAARRRTPRTLFFPHRS